MKISDKIKFPFKNETNNINPFSDEYRNNETRYKITKVRKFFLRPSKKDKIDFLNWMCIGVPKGGTTSLFQLLNEHPEVYIPESKETQFFSSIDYHKGISYYENSFFNKVNTDQHKAIGEISPKYLLHSCLVPKRIKKYLMPHLKFIVILRNPVDRAWSHYCHSYQRFKMFPFRPTEDLTFKEALSVEKKRLEAKYEDTFFHHSWNAYYYTGLYDIHLKKWFAEFERDRFLIIKLEELIENPTEIINSITQFLSISDFHSNKVFPKSNSFSQESFPEEIKNELNKLYRPHIKKLENLLQKDFSDWII